MPSIANLPVELTAQILCQCPDIKTALRLSATCRVVHRIWCDNAAHVVLQICPFIRGNLDDAVDFAELEVAAAQQVCLKTIDETDGNSKVRRYLPSIERIDFCASAIRTEYMAKLQKNRETFPQDPWESLNKYFEIFPDYCRSYLTIRRLTVGYDDFSVLPAAYARLHESSDEELDCLWTIVRLLGDECDKHWARMGIEKHDPEVRWWEDEPGFYCLPLSWEFVFVTIELEESFRFAAAVSDASGNEALHGHAIDFGDTRIAVMYGTAKPWNKKARRCELT